MIAQKKDKFPCYLLSRMSRSHKHLSATYSDVEYWAQEWSNRIHKIYTAQTAGRRLRELAERGEHMKSKKIGHIVRVKKNGKPVIPAQFQYIG